MEFKIEEIKKYFGYNKIKYYDIAENFITIENYSVDVQDLDFLYERGFVIIKLTMINNSPLTIFKRI